MYSLSDRQKFLTVKYKGIYFRHGNTIYCIQKITSNTPRCQYEKYEDLVNLPMQQIFTTRNK